MTPIGTFFPDPLQRSKFASHNLMRYYTIDCLLTSHFHMHGKLLEVKNWTFCCRGSKQPVESWSMGPRN